MIIPSILIASCAFVPGQGGRTDCEAELARRVLPAVVEVRHGLSMGSGVVVDGPGRLAVTNWHVLEGWGFTRVSTEADTASASLVALDRVNDLALLRVEGFFPLPQARLAARPPAIGETVWVIGHPRGLRNSMARGVVSALGRSISGAHRAWVDLIQVDAPLNPGNSGGALVNARGELIGIPCAGYANSEGLGFAVPVKHVKALLDAYHEREEAAGGKLRQAG